MNQEIVNIEKPKKQWKKGTRRYDPNLTMDEDLKRLEELDKIIKKRGYEDLQKLSLETFKNDQTLRFVPIKYRDDDLIQIKVMTNKYDSNAIRYTREKIQSKVSKFSKSLKAMGINGDITTTLFFNDLGYRPGYSRDVGKDISLYEVHDSDLEYYKEQKYFEEFNIYLLINKPQKFGKTNKSTVGKNSKYNDCFYICLVMILGDRITISPQKLKRKLGVGRFDGIDIKYMNQIESEIFHNKYSINIEGDYTYTSSNESKLKIFLKLSNGHYTVNHKATEKKKIYHIVEKKPFILDYQTFTGYDGEKVIELTQQDIYEYQSYDSGYIVVYKDDKKTFEEFFNEFNTNAKILKEKTNGIINLYKTGNPKDTALYLFDKYSKFTEIPEHIYCDESLWISEATSSALIGNIKYNGEAYEYDVKSQYPSILNSPNFTIPTGRGEFKTLSKEDFESIKFLQYGIYRCVIKKSDDDRINMLFRFNNFDKYTHISINHARLLGLEVEIIVDENFNALIYDGKLRKNARSVFGGFNDFVFPLKEQELPLCKDIINQLWGGLSQLTVKKFVIDMDSEKEEEIPENYKIISQSPKRNNPNVLIIEAVNNDSYFKNSFGRLAPFLISQARFKFCEKIKEHKESIVRIHTDGIFTKSKIEIETGSKLGDLVYSGMYKNIIVEGNGRPKGSAKSDRIF